MITLDQSIFPFSSLLEIRNYHSQKAFREREIFSKVNKAQQKIKR